MFSSASDWTSDEQSGRERSGAAREGGAEWRGAGTGPVMPPSNPQEVPPIIVPVDGTESRAARKMSEVEAERGGLARLGATRGVRPTKYILV